MDINLPNMDFDLNQVSFVTPPSLNITNSSSDNVSSSINNRFHSPIVESVFRDDAEMLHSDLIGIEECNEARTYNRSYSNETGLPYTRVPNTLINTYAEPTNSQYKHSNTIATTKDTDKTNKIIFTEEYVSSGNEETNPLSSFSNKYQSLCVFSKRNNQMQVSFEFGSITDIEHTTEVDMMRYIKSQNIFMMVIIHLKQPVMYFTMAIESGAF